MEPPNWPQFKAKRCLRNPGRFTLRHSLAGALKAAEVPVGTAESILGHASGSISYDLYGAGSGVEVTRMAEALVRAFVTGNALGR